MTGKRTAGLIASSALLLLACEQRERVATPENRTAAPAQERVEAVPAAPLPEQAKAAAAPAVAGLNPCFVQDGKPLALEPLRAVGTEPFWSARIEGRCVTYSHPDDQQGTRVWTLYAAQAEGGTWTGSLSGQPFELRTRAQAGCSDGMSDKVYPIAVELLVQGEKRSGCANEAR